MFKFFVKIMDLCKSGRFLPFLLLVSFILGFTISYLDMKSSMFDLKEQNKILIAQLKAHNDIVNNFRQHTIDSNHQIDSILNFTIEHFDKSMEEQTKEIKSMAKNK